MTQSSATALVAPTARPRATARVWALGTLLLCVFGFWLRWANAHSDLGSPSVDENDVIQQAVAFMGGEWRYYLPEYGPLPMYLLAALYHLVALLRGLSPLDYAARVFFDGQEHYLLGRLFCAACYVPLAICSYRFLAPRYGRSAASIGAALLSLPALDHLTKSTVRIDVPQGACQLGAMLLLVLALESGRWKHWLGAGLCAGLGMACKPLPGLLVAPCFVAASWYAAGLPGAATAAAPPRSVPGAVLLRAWRTFARPMLWGAGALALATALLANPTALDLGEFIRAQSKATAYYSGPNAPGAHLSAFEALGSVRLPLAISAGLCTLGMVFVPDPRAKLLALFPLVYATAFWGRPVRTYYMVAPMMVMCVVTAICVGLSIERRRPSGGALQLEDEARRVAPRAPWPGWLEPGLALVFVVAVCWIPVSTLYEGKQQVTNPTLSREWIHANIPSGTKLFHYGTFAGGPRLVAASSKQEREWADFFHYGRENYQFYGQAYRKAYQDYLAQGRPSYYIDSHRAIAEPAHKVSKWLARGLANRALKEGWEYIILAGYRAEHYRQLGYAWIDQVEPVKEFGKIVIFRVLRPAEPPAASTAVSGAAAAPATP